MIKTLALVGLLVAACVPQALALHRVTPPIQLLSNVGVAGCSASTLQSCHPGLAESSKPFAQGGVAAWIVFQSGADLKGLGGTFAGGQQIFLFDNNPIVGGRNLFQVTNFPGVNENPSLNENGKVVAFNSNANFLNLGAPGVHNIYTYDRESRQYHQWTFGSKDSTNPIVSPKGTALVFQSKDDLLGNGSTGTHIFMWQPKATCTLPPGGCPGSHLVQISPVGNSESGNAIFSVDSGASKIYFNTNAGSAHQQIAVYNRSIGTLTFLTNGNADSIKPTADNSGRWVSFQSRADLLANGSSGWEVFVLDTQTNTLEQVTNSPSGDSTEPSIGFRASYVAFVSTADLLGTGSTGKHLFIYDNRAKTTYQFTTGTGSAAHPMATGQDIFLVDSDEDPLKLNTTVRQVYTVNVFNWLPGPAIGLHPFHMLAGSQPGGSFARITTAAGVLNEPLDGSGKLDMLIGIRTPEGQAPIRVAEDSIHFPPIPLPDAGALCLSPNGNAGGFVDCDGGHPDSDITDKRDHHTDLADPFCLVGCREGTSCDQPLKGPHLRPCDSCLKQCVGGSLAGTRCVQTSDCQPPQGAGGVCVGNCGLDSLNAGADCDAEPTVCSPIPECNLDRNLDGHPDWLRGVCNGPQVTTYNAPFAAGAIRLNVPVTVRVSNDPGVDGLYCTADDTFPVAPIPTTLRITTGASTDTVLDADDVTATTVTDTQIGRPTDCNVLEAVNDWHGATLAATLQFLHVPQVAGLHDVVLGLSFGSGVCQGTGCPQACTTDAQCDDANACNGVETCGADGFCKPGVPIVCSDNDACNGLETCDPGTGTCLAGTAPNCDDSNLCTTDSCDPDLGCQNVPKVCDDNDACNGAETCNPADGTCQPGTPPTCDDGDPCNGVEGCAPLVGCTPGTPVVCDDGDPCNGTDTCVDSAGAAVCVIGPPPTCDDGNPCNGVESCTTGVGCTGGVPIVCADSDACNGTETCNPSNGQCQAGTPLACDDNDACTVDSCDSQSGCVHTPIGSPIALVLCRLEAMQAMLGSNPGTSPKTFNKLTAIVARVHAKMVAAQTATPKWVVKYSIQSRKLLRKFVKLVAPPHGKHQCTTQACSDLAAAASGIITNAITPLIAP